MDENSRITYRYIASVILGVILFAFQFEPFLPYSERMRPGHPPNWWSFPVIVLIAGFLLSLGLARHHFRVPICLLLTLFLANTILIVVDCIQDPTNHNLFPFEFALIAVLTLPAYLGAWIATVVDRFRARRVEA